MNRFKPNRRRGWSELFYTHGCAPLDVPFVLSSFKEVDAVPFLEGHNGLLPVRPFSVSSSQSLHLAQDIERADMQNLHFEESLDRMLNFDFVGLQLTSNA
jgi:hypothetical protein